MIQRILSRGAFRITFPVATALALFAISSCSGDDPVTPLKLPFSLQLSVTDTSGNPVEGLRVSVKSLLSNPPELLKTGTALPSARPTTTISFVAPCIARVTLEVRDATGGLLATLIEDSERAIGQHGIEWQPNPDVNDGVQKFQLTVREKDTGEVLFKETVYAMLYEIYGIGTNIGWTDKNGALKNKNDLLFPQLFDLPPIAMTNVIGENVGTTEYLSDVQITLVDTTSGGMTMVTRKIRGGENEISIVWDPQVPLGGVTGRQSKTGKPMTNRSSDGGPDPLTEWDLQQNFPNPFF